MLYPTHSVEQMQVSVTALCDFAARSGDLDLRFTPGPSAVEGMEGHRIIAARRAPGFASEVAVQGEAGSLNVRGRADGFSLALQLVEEVKTHKGPVDRIPLNQQALHWAQAMVYGHLLCREHGLAHMDVRLLYYDLLGHKEHADTRRLQAAELEQFFDGLCARFRQWGEQEQVHRKTLLDALQQLEFPLGKMRPGQRLLAQQVFIGARRGRVLLAQAPTGIGKSLGTLFPMLKAMGEDRIDKLLFLSAKTTGRAAALEALQRLRQGNARPPLRVVEITARDKVCVHPGAACHGESCPLARGFYDRLPQARLDAMRLAETQLLDQAQIAAVAAEHTICPYYLSQELVRWADVVVGDYNYWFDTSAFVYAMAVAEGWRAGLLVDEAHNLVERGRGMYSASLNGFALQGLSRIAPRPLKRPLTRLRAQWNRMMEQLQPGYQDVELDEEWLAVLQEFIGRTSDFLAEHPAELPAELQRFYFDAIQFTRLAEEFGDHSLCDVLRPTQLPDVLPRGRLHDGVLTLRNVVPAPFLRPRLQAAASAVLFSATLQPPRFYADMLGLPEDHAWLDVLAPFSAGQLQVHVVPISTRWNDRERSVEPIAELIVRQYRAHPGNYLAFFSSFAYLEKVIDRVKAMDSEIPLWEQTRSMREDERSKFLAGFQEGGSGIGFAVQGGAFGEGVDLPGSRLIGAFVATLGLPPVDPVHEAMRKRIEALMGQGFDYVYLFPGLRKVVQAAGRVVRTESDRGVVYLIDDRFERLFQRGLLPRWWRRG
ncbi:ATP-dependent DNA helicase [Brachymonas denitrificans]|uniref:Rad3-related DNA helicase n=1 Tax=Brachymonas denitrificans DSM 15123 TaxID=1121117 RepID=A0A1H8E235_9BURK|nr:ATP-dependent DNA helicase [Brachymonas denitrificans]SEN13503.1 Rad3-related DNA helicase [Brachymonas denitrificans DSM 15123]